LQGQGLASWLAPLVLLSLSNVFMTFAWYGHLKYKSAPLFLAIAVSWGIAFFEYCLAVPANRYGNAVYSRLEEGLIYVFKITPTGQVFIEVVPDM